MIDKNIKEYLLPYIVNAAIRAGAAIMEIYNSSNKEHKSTTKKDINNANSAAQNAIKETLGPTRIPILSEEGREMLYEERQNWEMFWLVDPLDGTVEFINRNNEFTVNIALMSGGEALLGVIYVPYLKKLYIAGSGYGSYLCEGVEPDVNCNMNYAQIRENRTQLPLITESRERQIVAISRSHITPETLSHIETLRVTHPDLEVVEQGSSYKFCLLAEAVVDYYIRTSDTFEWDSAAGELILSEAGGRTSTLEADTQLAYNKKELLNPWFKCSSSVSKIL
ncbi:MAG: 3'(2'),5'-bisphosphate nucleotidase CysQ [Rikenellaceae bacterium]